MERRKIQGWLTADEAARYLGVQPRTLATWRLNGFGPIYSAAFKRDPRYRVDDLDAFMRQGMARNTIEAAAKRRHSRSFDPVQAVA